MDVEVDERRWPYHSLNEAGQPDAQQRTSEYELTKLPHMSSLNATGGDRWDEIPGLSSRVHHGSQL